MSQVPAKGVCVGFTSDKDTFPMKYIATYNPTKKYRSGNTLYKHFVENVNNKWNWSGMHSWQSWQTQYRNHMEEFDRRIRKYQKKNRINLGKTHNISKNVVCNIAL
ncbi:hypothetical protein EV424DRAFT_1346861 [Suillus variegatus]|nr:hypothetical protein EV424DRAFT_1346861 [Suillus variegatus]